MLSLYLAPGHPKLLTYLILLSSQWVLESLFTERAEEEPRDRTDDQSGETTCQKAQEQRQNLNLSYDAKSRSLCPLTGCFRMIEIV